MPGAGMPAIEQGSQVSVNLDGPGIKRLFDGGRRSNEFF
jgi:hypothetical protein